MTSTDEIFIHGYNCHLSDFADVVQSFGEILAKIGNFCETNQFSDFVSNIVGMLTYTFEA